MINNYYSWLENIEAYVQIFVVQIHGACHHPFLYDSKFSSALQTHFMFYWKGYKYYFVCDICQTSREAQHTHSQNLINAKVAS